MKRERRVPLKLILRLSFSFVILTMLVLAVNFKATASSDSSNPGRDTGSAGSNTTESKSDDSSSGSHSSSKVSDDDREDAVNRLSRYYKNLEIVNAPDLTQEQLRRLKEICDQGRNTIAGTDDLRYTQMSDIESETKKTMDDYVASCIKRSPQTTADYLAVGDIYDIPIASYGQPVMLVLPLLNLGAEDLTNVIITPVVDGNVNKFPFHIPRESFTKEVPLIRGSHSYEEALAGRVELGWPMGVRDDVLDGYYKIDFNLVYMRKGVAEKATLSTYIKCIGAPGAGSVEDGENAKKSTPRIIVTGFSTDPGEVYAGSTFTLSIDVKNSSERTAVSNIQFDLKAAEEGKDKDTLYYSFLPTSGSNTIYVPHLEAGEETRLEIEMSAKADLVQKPYAIDMTMVYEDEKFNPYEAKTSISVPVRQLSRVEYSTAEVVPDTIEVGAQSNVMFSVYNTGKTILYNVKVRFDDPAVTGGDAYVGKLESGATGNVDVMLTGAAAGGEGGIKGIISYENDAGKVTEEEFRIQLTVNEGLPEVPVDMAFEGELPDMEPEAAGLPVWGVALIIIGIVAAAAVLIIIILRKKKNADN